MSPLKRASGAWINLGDNFHVIQTKWPFSSLLALAYIIIAIRAGQQLAEDCNGDDVSHPDVPVTDSEFEEVGIDIRDRIIREYFAEVIIFTKVMMPLSIILIVGVLSSIQAEVQKTCEEEYLSDIQQKVKDLWLTMLHATPFQANPDGVSYGTCVLKPSTKLQDSDLKVTGEVLFKQSFSNRHLEAIFIVEGFPMDNNQTVRAIHIHNFGDLSDSCDSAGGHYNPFSVNHPDHPGDFGNFRVIDGKIIKYVSCTDATMFGPYSILGRSIVVHMQADDLGKGNNQASLDNGNAGKRLACCVIGFSNKNNWERRMEEMPGLKTQRLYKRANKKKSVKG
uniref:Superoxide dismutase [Cu-Zn] n=1 Tax=Leptobrachium leishanense TaxID=445787 RepID=A0A8C5LW06_9ANUR